MEKTRRGDEIANEFNGVLVAVNVSTLHTGDGNDCNGNDNGDDS